MSHNLCLIYIVDSLFDNFKESLSNIKLSASTNNDALSGLLENFHIQRISNPTLGINDDLVNLSANKSLVICMSLNKPTKANIIVLKLGLFKLYRALIWFDLFLVCRVGTSKKKKFELDTIELKLYRLTVGRSLQFTWMYTFTNYIKFIWL